MSTDMTLYQPKNLSELKEFCQMITKTNLVPTAYKGKAEDAMVAMMFGHETGQLGPLTSLQFIAVINGRPGYYSDAVPGVALNKGLITDIEEFTEGNPYDDDFKHVVIVTKRNGKQARSEFSVGDAKRAGLWNKAGPWTQYPKRMLQWRAKGFGVRDAAPHLLFGQTVEELRDVEDQAQRHPEDAKDVTPTPRAQPAPPELLELIDPYGQLVQIQPVELEGTLRDWTTVASDAELHELAENNREIRQALEAVEAEQLRRLPHPRSRRGDGRSSPPAAETPASQPTEAVEPRLEDPLHLHGLKGAIAFLAALRLGIEQASAIDADRYWELYRERAQAADSKVNAGDYASIEALVADKIEGRA